MSDQLSALVMDLAFAIDDPCGIDAIELARALLLIRLSPNRRIYAFI